jgi:hypothetical protein
MCLYQKSVFNTGSVVERSVLQRDIANEIDTNNGDKNAKEEWGQVKKSQENLQVP